MPKQKPGMVQRFAASFKAAALTWGGAQSSQTSLQSEISATLVGGIPVGKVRLSTDSFYTLWRNQGDIFGCVREIADGVGVAGWKWINKKNPDKEPNPQSVEYAESVLTFYSTMRAWYREIITDVKICGNAYYHVEKNKGNGNPVALQRLDPRTLTAVTDKYGTLRRWIQRAGADVVDFKPEEIVHFYTLKDPNSPVYGISPMEPVLWDVRTDLAAMISNYALFENDAVPAAMYVFEDEMSDEEIDHAVGRIKEQLKGAENRHKAMAMKGLKEIKTVSVTNKDMEFIALRRLTTEKVCATYGVPKGMLGYTDSINLANGQEQTQHFWEGTVENDEEQLSEFINRVFLPIIGIDDITHEFNVRSFDSREWDESSTRADLQLGVTTINEVRVQRKLQPFDKAKYGELVDAPLIYAGLSVRPLEDVGVDLIEDPGAAIIDETATEKSLQRLDHLGRAYEDRKKKSKPNAR